MPCLGNQELTLNEVAKLISDRLVNMFRRGRDGRIPALPENSPFQRDPAWRDLLLFNEYFHGETGLGLGAMHQTGWTGLVANLVQRRYRDGHSGVLEEAAAEPTVEAMRRSDAAKTRQKRVRRRVRMEMQRDPRRSYDPSGSHRVAEPARLSSRSTLLAASRCALASHWPEYLMEAAGLGLFMISACAFVVLLEHPGSPVRSGVAAIRPAPAPDRPRDGPHGDRDHLLAAGQALGRAPQSGGDAHVLAAGQDRRLGRSVLHRWRSSSAARSACCWPRMLLSRDAGRRCRASTMP